MTTWPWTKGMRLETDRGLYLIDADRPRGENPYYTLNWTPGGNVALVCLGDSRPGNEADWKRAGTLREVRALARLHYDQQADPEGSP